MPVETTLQGFLSHSSLYRCEPAFLSSAAGGRTAQTEPAQPLFIRAGMEKPYSIQCFARGVLD